MKITNYLKKTAMIAGLSTLLSCGTGLKINNYDFSNDPSNKNNPGEIIPFTYSQNEDDNKNNDNNKQKNTKANSSRQTPASKTSGKQGNISDFILEEYKKIVEIKNNKYDTLFLSENNIASIINNKENKCIYGSLCKDYKEPYLAIEIGEKGKPNRITYAGQEKITEQKKQKEHKQKQIEKILVLMYHNIGDKHKRYWVTPEDFKSHLEQLHNNNYQTISLDDYVNQDFSSLKPGKKPVLLTFDDASDGQFTYLTDKKGELKIKRTLKGLELQEEPIIDSNCAVGIMKEFYQEHPDFGFKGIFYVDFDGGAPFLQKNLVKTKLNHLLDMGLEIGNHTYSHPSLNKLKTVKKIKDELGKAMYALEGYLGDRISEVKSIAYPYGDHPSLINSSVRYIKVKHKDKQYTLTSAVDAYGWGSAPHKIGILSIPRIETDNKPLPLIWKWAGNYENEKIHLTYNMQQKIHKNMIGN